MCKKKLHYIPNRLHIFGVMSFGVIFKLVTPKIHGHYLYFRPKCNACDKLANFEKLFVNWMYSTFAIDQSLCHNRQKQHDSENCILSAQSKNDDFEGDKITKIYACATMWHENPEEMMEMLKSLYRMDLDQCTKRIQINNTGKMDSDYYEFECKAEFICLLNGSIYNLMDNSSVNFWTSFFFIFLPNF